MSEVRSTIAVEITEMNNVVNSFATYTRERFGVATKVIRIVPCEYSCVAHITPNTPSNNATKGAPEEMFTIAEEPITPLSNARVKVKM
jgi:hypothetical protein